MLTTKLEARARHVTSEQCEGLTISSLTMSFLSYFFTFYPFWVIVCSSDSFKMLKSWGLVACIMFVLPQTARALWKTAPIARSYRKPILQAKWCDSSAALTVLPVWV